MTGTSDLPRSIYAEINDSFTLAGPSADRVHRHTMSSLRAPAPNRSSLASTDLISRLAERFAVRADRFDFYSDCFALSPDERPLLYAGENFYSDRFALSDYEEEKPKKARRGRKPKAKMPEFESKPVETVKDAKDERIQMLELELERLRSRTPAPEADEPNPPRRGRKPKAKEVEAESDKEQPATIEVELPAEEKEEPKTRKSRKATATQIKAAFAALQLLLPSESEEDEPQSSRPARKQNREQSSDLPPQTRRGCKPKLGGVVEDEEALEELRSARGRKRKAVEIEEEQPQAIRKSRRNRSKVSYQEDSD